ncbi:DUF1080 domain-containing protein [Chitinophagaceae bacterium LB-8]|uniref:DUF1080 domain-containing protein n=1 Tax=Paraflavisolibacter caeni TaxID=2982496 RepID=A0A9X2XTJ9_9BACT|nr:DUF1080 domain-containing protein [Paraflavisolibacter caeni]MCU7548187.1 DUF1080 domain-containing protein [Paraflavisolibacter caeni]
MKRLIQKYIQLVKSYPEIHNTYYVVLLGLMFLIGSCSPSKSVSKQSGTQQIFDGKTLKGWEGDPLYWRVENGSIVGEVTPSTLLKRNSFLIWRGGTVQDFELEVDYRITLNGNSGINYRSEEIDSIPLALRGYQGDIGGRSNDNYTGMNYEERRRTTIAKRGQRVELPPVAKDSLQAYIKNNTWTPSVVLQSLGSEDSLRNFIHAPGSWNHYKIIAKGNHIQHYVNGVLMSEVIDHDPVNGRMTGLLGVQVHVGPPMKVEFRNFKLTHLNQKS